MSEFWKRKMRTYIASFDFDKDGVVSKDEWDTMPVQFATSEKADKQKTEHLKIQFDNLWKQYLKFADNKNVLTAEVLYDSFWKQRYHPDLKERMSNVIHGLFDLMDVNYDGYLQQNEYRRLFQQLGVHDTSFSKKTFMVLDLDHDGKLSFNEFVEACFDFFFSEDENSPNTFFLGPLVD